MSNLKARLMKPTGLEYHDLAFEIDREIWNFIKHEYKNKSRGNGEGALRRMDRYYHALFGQWPRHGKGGKNHDLQLLCG